MRIKVHGLRRILVGITIFCLAVTSPGAQPAQASPSGRESKGVEVTFDTRVKDPICLGKDKELSIKAHYVIPHSDEWIALEAPSLLKVKSEDFKFVPLTKGPPEGTQAMVHITAELGTIKLAKGVSGQQVTYYEMGPFTYGKVKPIEFSYVLPKKEGAEKITITVRMVKAAKGKGNPTPLGIYGVAETSFELKQVCAWNINGSTNVNQVLGSMMAGGPWDPIAMYDISGTIETDEDGNLHGNAVVNLFTDAVWTGQGWENATCSLSGPWEGRSTAKLEADPNAWAQEDEIDLKVDLEPLPVDAGLLNCCIDGNCHTSPMPGYTIASFDLDFDPLSAEGGITDLEFHFPAGHTPLKMQLIVSPQEAGS